MKDKFQKYRNKKDKFETNYRGNNVNDIDEDNEDIINEEVDLEEIQEKKRKEKSLKVFGSICIVAFIVGMKFMSSSSINKTNEAKEALETKISTSLSAGTILLSSDENIGQQDYEIIHNLQNDETKIVVWDYAAEDGDYVQVLVNGQPISEPFMIKHKPKEIIVPTTGDIQIKGIKDGGGGITYAIRYELNGTNYFNSAPEGEYNTYTLIKE